MHQTYMLTTHACDGTQRPHNTSHTPPLPPAADPPPGRSGQARWICPQVAQGVVSSARVAAAGVDEDQAWSSQALSSSRQAPDALTYISLSQTVSEIE